MIDSNLTWHSHIENISKKMSRAIGLLYKIRPFVNIKIMKTLYYALVYPHILYAIEVWGSAGITILNRLLVLQKRIVRLLSYSDTRNSDYSFPPSNPLVFKEQMLKVQDLFKMRIVKFIHNCLNKTSVNFHLWFKLTILIHIYSNILALTIWSPLIIYLFQQQEHPIMVLNWLRYKDPKFGLKFHL